MITLFLSGDVMTGRGIDQIMPSACDPVIYESCVRDARGYVLLAERVNGTIPRVVGPEYIWGEGLTVLQKMNPDFRIINLETAITNNSEPWLDKGINYRMHPDNVSCLVAANIDCCILANNHVLDWHYAGLGDTLAILKTAGIAVAGAGCNLAEARQPARLIHRTGVRGEVKNARVLVYSFCLTSSGVPETWRAGVNRAGINLLPDLSGQNVQDICHRISIDRNPGDIVVVSIHWGGNWGYAVPESHRHFARCLIDEARVSIVHGHSSHHAKAIENHHGGLILYGCGDLINDYEGISGYNQYKGYLSLMYFAGIDTVTGELIDLTIIPMRMKQFRLQHAAGDDIDWLCAMLNRESNLLNARFTRCGGALILS